MRMKWKDYEVVLFVACSICINFFGKWFAQFFELPLWMDCIGTIFVAYVLGPVCGGIVGVEYG